jgi:hypothetical protein
VHRLTIFKEQCPGFASLTYKNYLDLKEHENLVTKVESPAIIYSTAICAICRISRNESAVNQLLSRVDPA